MPEKPPTRRPRGRIVKDLVNQPPGETPLPPQRRQAAGLLLPVSGGRQRKIEAPIRRPRTRKPPPVNCGSTRRPVPRAAAIHPDRAVGRTRPARLSRQPVLYVNNTVYRVSAVKSASKRGVGWAGAHNSPIRHGFSRRKSVAFVAP